MMPKLATKGPRGPKHGPNMGPISAHMGLKVSVEQTLIADSFLTNLNDENDPGEGAHHIVEEIRLMHLGVTAPWLLGWQAGWQADWLVDCLASWLAGWLAGWLIGWLAECLASWLAGWLAGCGWLAGWLDKQNVKNSILKQRTSICELRLSVGTRSRHPPEP
jgi:hypothetical protein